MQTLDLRLSRLNSCKTVTHHMPARVEIDLAFLKCLEKNPNFFKTEFQVTTNNYL